MKVKMQVWVDGKTYVDERDRYVSMWHTLMRLIYNIYAKYTEDKHA